jgi:exopolysaccharide biosynthesis protein
MKTTTINYTQLYPGIDHATATNAQWTYPNVNILRVDLSNPNISFLTTPTAALDYYGVRSTEFLKQQYDPATMEAMFATNANFFDMDQRNLAYGLLVSQGDVVFPDNAGDPCTLLINQQNEAHIDVLAQGDEKTINPAAENTYTAVSGNFILVQDGNNVAPPPQTEDPEVAARTAIGISAPAGNGFPQYLFLVTIDGQDQSPVPPEPYYGGTYQDTADWLIAAGAWTALNLDGGGSTTMAKINGLLPPLQASLMNQPHDDEGSMQIIERHVCASFGVVVGK